LIRATYPNLEALWKGVFFKILDDEPGVIDLYGKNIVHSFGNVVTARDGVFDFDLGEVGLTVTKWTKFTNMYVDIENLHAWVQNAMKVKSYDAMFPFKVTPPEFHGTKAVHQWGPCILGISFRRQPIPTLTFYTRAQSLGFSGIADYALLHFIIKKLKERMRGRHGNEPIRTVIYCSNFIIKMVETVHTLEKWGLLEKYSEADTRIGNSIRYYINYMTNDAPELKWRAANRMRTKWRRAQDGESYSLPVDSLSLRGWDAYGRKKITRTHREVQQLVLKDRERMMPLEIPGDTIAALSELS
jgi:hypothetical protein